MCPSEFVQLDCTWLLPPHLTAEMTVGNTLERALSKEPYLQV